MLICRISPRSLVPAEVLLGVRGHGVGGCRSIEIGVRETILFATDGICPRIVPAFAHGYVQTPRLSSRPLLASEEPLSDQTRSDRLRDLSVLERLEVATHSVRDGIDARGIAEKRSPFPSVHHDSDPCP